MPRRTRSAVTFSQMLNLSFSCCFVSNRSWTRMHFRLPPSSLFNSKIAWAVVPEPAKESRMIESLSHDNSMIRRINSTGLGVTNTSRSPMICLSCTFAPELLPAYWYGHHVEGTTPFLTSFKYSFMRGRLLPSLPHQTFLSVSAFQKFSSDILQ